MDGLTKLLNAEGNLSLRLTSKKRIGAKILNKGKTIFDSETKDDQSPSQYKTPNSDIHLRKMEGKYVLSVDEPWLNSNGEGINCALAGQWISGKNNVYLHSGNTKIIIYTST